MHWNNNLAVYEGEEFTPFWIQWRAFLYVYSTTYHIQCWVRFYFLSVFVSLLFGSWSFWKTLSWIYGHIPLFCYVFYISFEMVSFPCSNVSLLIWIRFQVKKKQFFRNFLTINLFGVVGSLISFCIISYGMLSIALLVVIVLVNFSTGMSFVLICLPNLQLNFSFASFLPVITMVACQ